MKISTTQLFENSLRTMLSQQSKLSELQQNVATGKRIIKPSDDPAGAVQITDLKTALSRQAQYQANGDAADARLSLEEVTLGSAVNIFQGLREKVVQAGNSVNNLSNFSAIADDVEAKLNEMLSLANTVDANGEYIFAGNKSQTQPFVKDLSGNFVYQGDQGQRQVRIGDTRSIAQGDSGFDVFLNLKNGKHDLLATHNPANTGTGAIGTPQVDNAALLTGNTYAITFTGDPMVATVTNTADASVVAGPQSYTDGGGLVFDGVSVDFVGQPLAGDTFTVGPSQQQNIFQSLGNLVSALRNPDNNVQNEVNRALENVESGMENISRVRSYVGARLSSIETVKNANQDLSLQLSQTLSSIEDIDLLEAASQLTLQTTSLQAAQASFVRVQNLSLFNFL